MPTIYQGICRECDHKTPLFPGGYGAVLVDRPLVEPQHEVAGAVVMSGEEKEIASVADPRFAVLRHPAEDFDLAKTGYRWRDLLREGRYVAVRNVICRECGTVFPRRSLGPPGGTGCLTGMALGVAAGLAAGLWNRSVITGLLTWYLVTTGVTIGVDLIARAYVRLRFASRARALAAERSCPTCRADNVKAVGMGGRFTCPACRKRSLRFVIVGKS